MLKYCEQLIDQLLPSEIVEAHGKQALRQANIRNYLFYWEVLGFFAVSSVRLNSDFSQIMREQEKQIQK